MSKSKNNGSGVGGVVFLVVIVGGVLIKYWYVTVPVIVALVVAFLWMKHRQKLAVAAVEAQKAAELQARAVADRRTAATRDAAHVLRGSGYADEAVALTRLALTLLCRQPSRWSCRRPATRCCGPTTT